MYLSAFLFLIYFTLAGFAFENMGYSVQGTSRFALSSPQTSSPKGGQLTDGNASGRYKTKNILQAIRSKKKTKQYGRCKIEPHKSNSGKKNDAFLGSARTWSPSGRAS